MFTLEVFKSRLLHGFSVFVGVLLVLLIFYYNFQSEDIIEHIFFRTTRLQKNISNQNSLFKATQLKLSINVEHLFCSNFGKTSVPMKAVAEYDPWVTVGDIRADFFSAYFYEADLNKTSTSQLRILVLKQIAEKRSVVCIVMSSNDNETWIVTVHNSTWVLINADPSGCPDHNCNHQAFEAYYLNCRIKHPLFKKFALNYVSFTTPGTFRNTCEHTLKHPKLPVSITPQWSVQNNRPKPIQFAICVAPTFRWDNGIRFRFFLEHYLAQGFTKFVFYKRRWTSEIDKIVVEDRYRKYIDVVHWPLFPNETYRYLDTTNPMVEYTGQILAMNECTRRLRGKARFAAHIDLDEYIIPTNKSYTLPRLLLEKDKPEIGGFLALNNFVSFKFDNLSDFTKITVEPNVWRPRERSKMIVKPEAVERQSVHVVWEYAKGFREDVLASDTVKMFHWRPELKGETLVRNFSDIFFHMLSRLKYINGKLQNFSNTT